MRIIKRYNLFFRPRKITHFGKIKEIRRRKKLRRKGYEPQRAGDLIQVDGIKRYILTGVDLKSKFAFAYACPPFGSRRGYNSVWIFDEAIRHLQGDTIFFN